MVPNTSNNKYINLSYFIRELDGNHEIICLNINNFIKMLASYFETMKEGVEGSNWDLVHMASHKMKPSLQMFGLETFYEVHTKIVEASRTIENTEMISKWHETQKDLYPFIMAELLNEQKKYCHS